MEHLSRIIAQKDVEALLITGSREEFKCDLNDTRLQRGSNPCELSNAQLQPQGLA